MEKVIILDFGSQYTQLIARRLRELKVYSEILPYNSELDLADPHLKAVILSGSPFSVNDPNALHLELAPILDKKPILGICYGAQLTAKQFGGRVEQSDKREYGKASMRIAHGDTLFEDVEDGSQVWMSHGDSIKQLPDGFEILADTASIPVAAFRSAPGRFKHSIRCIQFHPEVTHSLQGEAILRNFLVKTAGCSQDWTPASFIDLSLIHI